MRPRSHGVSCEGACRGVACPPALPGRRLGVLGLLIAASGLSGCTIGFETLDLALVERASTAFADRSSRHPLAPNEEVVSSAPPGTGSVILGELIAIFPGFIVKGLGHYYAGDAKTATKLRLP